VAEPSAGDQRLVLVGGLHRSGTSLLAQLIADHPEASGLSGTGVMEDEGQHLQDVYPSGATYGGPGRFARASDAHLTETSPLATPETARKLRAAWDPYWDTSKRLLVEKSPPNLIMGRLMQAVFPDAALVFIVRHPVAVTLATVKWRPRTTLPRLMEHWFHAHDVARSDQAYLRNAHVVSYEHLLHQTADTLLGVQRFLGLTTAIPSDRIKRSGSAPYAQQWQAMLDDGDRGAGNCVKTFDDRAASYGYDLKDLSVGRADPLAASG
jgi:hypothetical protein